MFKRYNQIIFIISLFIGVIFIYTMSGIDFDTIKLYNKYHDQKDKCIIDNKKLKQKIILDETLINDEIVVNKANDEYNNTLYQEIENDELKINILKNEIPIKLLSETDKYKPQILKQNKKISYMKITNYPHYKSDKKYRICFGSCNVNPKNARIWQNISSYQPDLWMFLGDSYYNDIDIDKNKYVKNSNELLVNHLKILDKMKYNPSFQNFLKVHKYFAIWDDHDYYQNNDDFEVNDQIKLLFRHSFLKFFNVPKNDVRYHREGIYTFYDLIIEDKHIIRFFLLDVRTTKNNLDILGREQWKWFEKNIKNSTAHLNLVISGTAFMADSNPKNNFESWEKTGWSYKKLEELLNTYNLKNVILISGDIHLGRTMVRNHLIEFTSSSLTSRPSKLNITSDMGDPMTKNNFGFIDIDYSDINNPKYIGGLINLENGNHSNLIQFETI